MRSDIERTVIVGYAYISSIQSRINKRDPEVKWEKWQNLERCGFLFIKNTNFTCGVEIE